jgi:tetratricopeptide (TPR) repeat protein
VPTITTSQAKQRVRIIIGAITIVGVLALGAGLWWWQGQEAIKVDNQRFAALLQTSEVLAGRAKYDEAARAWAAYAPEARTADHKRSAYLEAASMYMTIGSLSQVVQMCKKAESASGVTYDEARLAAQAYAGLGDKTNAIHYYQEAARLVPQSLGAREAMVAILNQAIKDLQAQQ